MSSRTLSRPSPFQESSCFKLLDFSNLYIYICEGLVEGHDWGFKKNETNLIVLEGVVTTRFFIVIL